MAMGEKLLYDTGIHLLPEKNTNDNQLLRQKNAGNIDIRLLIQFTIFKHIPCFKLLKSKCHQS
jgi:hypothetical protein